MQMSASLNKHISPPTVLVFSNRCDLCKINLYFRPDVIYMHIYIDAYIQTYIYTDIMIQYIYIYISV